MQTYADDSAGIGIDRFELPAGRVGYALAFLRDAAGEQENETAERVDLILLGRG